MMVAILQCAYPLGWLLSSLIVAPLIEHVSWRSLFYIGFVVAPVGLALGYFLPSDKYGRQAITFDAGQEKLVLPIKSLFSKQFIKTTLMCAVAFFFYAGSVAGMEAAWVAGARGHQVTVLGMGSYVAGKARIHTGLPGGENLSSIYDYQLLSAKHANVIFELGRAADVSAISALEPDHVILATGSTMRWPNFLPTEYKGEVFLPDLRELVISFGDRVQKQSGRIVIFDHDHTEMTYAGAEFYADIFDEVVLITPRERVASDVSLVNRQGIYERLYNKNVMIITSSMPSVDSNFEEGQLLVENVYNKQPAAIDDIAVFTYSTPRKPNDDLRQPLEDLGITTSLVGDCLPRALYSPQHVKVTLLVNRSKSCCYQNK